MSLTYGSVCSGIEAASVAWEPLGWTPAWFAEIESFPSSVLARRWPSVSNRGDFTRIHADADARLAGPIDLLVGGTPCQSFSVAGLRRGLADPRGNLALEFLRLADGLRPEWLVWENVPGVLSSGRGRDFGAFLGALGQLGYGWAYRILDAQYVRVDGFGRAVPQRRRRVFVVGCLGGWQRAVAVLFDREGLSGHPAPRRQAGQGTAPDASPSLRARHNASHRLDSDAYVAESVSGTLTARFSKNSGGSNDDIDCGRLVAHAFGGNNTTGPIDVATALNACSSASGRMDFGSETFVAHTLKAEGFDASEDGTGRGIPLVPVQEPCGRGGPASVWGDVVVSPTLQASDGGPSNGYVPVVPCTFQNTGQGWWNQSDVATTIRTPEGSGSLEANVVAIPIDLRQASRGEKITNNRAEGPSGGAPGHGVGDPGDPAFTVSERGQAVAFQCQGTNVSLDGDAAGTLRGGNEHLTGGGPCVAIQDGRAIAKAQNGRGFSGDGSAYTVDTTGSQAVATRWAVRRLTPLECERLQGFPDHYTLIPMPKGKGKNRRGRDLDETIAYLMGHGFARSDAEDLSRTPDGPRYKALGNSMAVNCMRWIGRRIEMVRALARSTGGARP